MDEIDRAIERLERVRLLLEEDDRHLFAMDVYKVIQLLNEIKNEKN